MEEDAHLATAEPTPITAEHSDNKQYHLDKLPINTVDPIHLGNMFLIMSSLF